MQKPHKRRHTDRRHTPITGWERALLFAIAAMFSFSIAAIVIIILLGLNPLWLLPCMCTGTGCGIVLAMMLR